MSCTHQLHNSYTLTACTSCSSVVQTSCMLTAHQLRKPKFPTSTYPVLDSLPHLNWGVRARPNPWWSCHTTPKLHTDHNDNQIQLLNNTSDKFWCLSLRSRKRDPIINEIEDDEKLFVHQIYLVFVCAYKYNRMTYWTVIDCQNKKIGQQHVAWKCLIFKHFMFHFF